MNNTAWQRVRREAGLCAVRIHDLRHTFGRRLLYLATSIIPWPATTQVRMLVRLLKQANLVLNRQETRTVLRVANARESVLWIKGPARVKQASKRPHFQLVTH